MRSRVFFFCERICCNIQAYLDAQSQARSQLGSYVDFQLQPSCDGATSEQLRVGSGLGLWDGDYIYSHPCCLGYSFVDRAESGLKPSLWRDGQILYFPGVVFWIPTLLLSSPFLFGGAGGVIEQCWMLRGLICWCSGVTRGATKPTMTEVCFIQEHL